MIYKGGKIVLSDTVREDLAVITRGEKIAAIVPDSDIPGDEEVINLDGDYLMPGFVDIHVHGGGGYDFMDASPDEIREIAKIHVVHGTTSLCPTAMTSTKDRLFDFLDACAPLCGADTGGADFIGLHLEGPYLSSANRGAQPTQYASFPERTEVEEILRRANGKIVRFDAAPELPGMKWFAERMCRDGILCSAAHSAATAEEMLEAYRHGFTHITHLYCSTTTEHKVNGVVHGGIVEAAYLEDGITIELIGDGIHIPRETMLLGFKLKGNGRLALITDAMRAAGTNVRNSILGCRAEGTSVIIEDGVAKLPDRSSFAGSIATMDQVFRVVHSRYGVPLCDTVRAMTETPAKLVGVSGRKGRIHPGMDADLIVMTHDFRVRQVYVRGRRL